MGNELATQASTAVLLSYALQWLKTSKWFPFITTETQALNRWVSAIVGFVSGFGIFATWDHSAGALTITGLTAANLLHAAVRGVQQFVFQHAAYRTLVAPPLPGAEQSQAADLDAAMKRHITQQQLGLANLTSLGAQANAPQANIQAPAPNVKG